MKDIITKFLEEELKHCIELQNSFSLFPVHVPSAQAVAKADAFLKLETLLEIEGPFSRYKKETKKLKSQIMDKS